MKRVLMSMVAGLLVISIGACSSPPTKQESGAVLGGLIGGALGSRFGKGDGRTAAVMAGTLIGAMIGMEIGRYMDEVDRMKLAQTLEYNPTSRTSSWVNPDTHNEYAVTPTRTYYSDEGPCREFVMDAYIGGKKEQVYGTACRQPDGSWKTVSN